MIEELDFAELLNIGSGIFALILLLISLLAYSRSRQNRLLFIGASFFLYFIKIGMEHIDFIFPNLESSLIDLTLATIDFVILFLFFLAVIKK